jgi:hypothetical protein
MQDDDIAVTLVGQDSGENLVDRALFAFQCLQKGAAVKNQHAADAERPVARPCAEQKLSQVCGGKVFGSGAGIDNLMHAILLNSRAKA